MNLHLAASPASQGAGASVYCPCCHRRLSYNAARSRAIAAAASAEQAKAEPRHGDPLIVGEILPTFEMGRFLGRDQFVLLPIRDRADHRGRYKVLSDGILALGVTWAQVTSRGALAAALLRAEFADRGFCPRCIEILAETKLPSHLSFWGDEPRLYYTGGFFAPNNADEIERSFLEWGVELRAKGHDTSGDPRFHGPWAEDEHRGVLSRRRQQK